MLSSSSRTSSALAKNYFSSSTEEKIVVCSDLDIKVSLHSSSFSLRTLDLSIGPKPILTFLLFDTDWIK
jgi:hypothetical protein